MKAIGFHSTGKIEHLEILALPQLKAPLITNQVRVRFLAGALNHLDLWVLKGLPRVNYTYPHYAGADAVVQVLESKSVRFKTGDRVLIYPAESLGKSAAGELRPENLCEDFKIRGENTLGVFREEFEISDRYLIAAPSHLSDAEAAAVPLVYLTAWQMLTEKAGLHPQMERKDWPILLAGAGSGVTHALLELLLSMKFSNLHLSSRDPKKLEKWKARGVHTYSTRDVSLLPKTQKFSIIFDHVGAAVFENNIRLLENGGKFVTCGATSGHAASLDLRHLYFRQLQLLGSTMGSLKHFHEVIEWIEISKIRPIVAAEFPFEKVRDAYRMLEEQHQDGKIIVRPKTETL